jgi:hypothetical protein
MYLEKINNVFELGNNMCTVAGLGLYIGVYVVTPKEQVLAHRIGWVGSAKPHSRAPLYCPAKVIELVRTLNPGVPFDMTPTTHAAGLRFIGVSGWDHRHDALVALILNYAMFNHVRLHHVGWRHATLNEQTVAVTQTEQKLGTTGTNHDVTDHKRTFVTDRKADPFKAFWVEHQYFHFPEGPHTKALHWDLVTSEPKKLLGFLGKKLNNKVVTWEDAGENDPIGVVWEGNNPDEILFGVMARGKWWNVNK